MPSLRLFFRGAPVAFALSLAGLLSACHGSDEKKTAGPKQVAVVTLAPEKVTLTTELAGRAVASEESEVRPQVSGILQRRLFEEGSEVRAGQPLFQIEPTLYQAAARQAEADLSNAEAALATTRLKAERYRSLGRGQLAAQQDIDDAEAAYRQAIANRDAASAALQTARTNLRFATVDAPIGGRIGRSLVTPGALVTANQAGAIAKIQKLDPMNVDLTQSGSQYLALRREIAAGGVLPASTEVKLKLADGTDYPLPGRLEFADIDVAEDTGTVTLRAQFPNPDRQLLPGMYVRAIVEQGVRERAILVPQAAVDRTPRGLAQVWVVGKDGKAYRRELKTARAVGDRWLVDAGLAAGDQVVVEGAQGLAEGMPVKVAPAASVAGGG
ncbi:efflux RND transporter periplasmic adaptor subunit [Pseudomonas sp. Hp2]|uniref:efflux RND transporter periplasmic adaptor subunit n=1 Tax=Pseudomonas sp. Hp2 TaxID=701189 RepID=UPI001126577B|nr:efflux RND transporter periplasmic adaptor subunit [Pseudomonas sp. Hp2]